MKFSGVGIGDVAIVSGTFICPEKATRYTVEESAFQWNGTVWVPYLRVVREKGQALMDTLRAACYAEGMGNVTVSIGISLYDQDADTFEGLYEKADQAMYVSKRNGKDQLYFAADVL